jgi:ADP-heptose:LPS heptosyltransferase
VSEPAAGQQRDLRFDPPPPLWARLLGRLAALLLPLRGGRPSPAELRRILVVRPDDRVGNALLTLPLVRALQQALPGAQIDLLLPAGRDAVLRGLPGVTLVPFEKQRFFRAPLRFLAALRALRAAGYDAALDASHWHSYSLTAALLTRVATRRFTVGGSNYRDALHSVTVDPPGPALNEVESKLLLLAGVGLPVPAQSPPLETALGLSVQAQAFAQSVLEAHALVRFAALNIGARKADHRWAPWKFAALARGLREGHGLLSLVLWGPGEEELARAVVEGAGGAAVLAPPSDLDELAAVFRKAALVAANDTGPLHLAVACGAKVVALQLASDGARWSHRGPRFAPVEVHVLAQGSFHGALLSDVGAALGAAARLLALTEPPAQATLGPGAAGVLLEKEGA